MMKNIKHNFFAQYIRNLFTLGLSKWSVLSQSKINSDFELQDEQFNGREVDANSQQYLHPYLIDRVEPSVHHIIFSSYIKY